LAVDACSCVVEAMCMAPSQLNDGCTVDIASAPHWRRRRHAP
jgi:hypothetical protein